VKTLTRFDQYSFSGADDSPLSRFKGLFRRILLLLPLIFFVASVEPASTFSETPLTEAWITAGVPFFPQEELGCGPAALSSLLTYWGRPVTLEEITREVELKQGAGSLPLDLELAAIRHGFAAESYAGSLEDLRHHLSRNQPIIVFLNLGWRVFPQGHFVVVTGLDEARSEILMHSGEVAYQRISYDRFMNAWSKTGRWSLLILPKEVSSSG